MRRKKKYLPTTAPSLTSPGPGTTPGTTTGSGESHPAGLPQIHGEHLPALPRLSAQTRAEEIRTEDDEVRDSARTRALALIASRSHDALNTPDPVHRYSTMRPLAGDAVAAHLGSPAFSTTYRSPVSGSHDGQQASAWVAAEDLAETQTPSQVVTLSDFDLFLPTVSPVSLFEQLVAETGFTPPVLNACAQARRTIAAELGSPANSPSGNREDGVVESPAATAAVDDVLDPVAADRPAVTAAPGTTETGEAQADTAAPDIEINDLEWTNPDPVVDGEAPDAQAPVDGEVVEGAVEGAEEPGDAYQELMRDVRAYSDLPAPPPMTQGRAHQ